MSYGQYSAGGGLNRTKAEMLATFSCQGLDIDESTARKGGKNRLMFTTRDGARHFTLHETAVATLSADGTRLTLADGGWPTPTTRTAWDQALTAFGISGMFRWGETSCTFPTKSERSVSYMVAPDALFPPVPGSRWASQVRPYRVTGRADDAPKDLPMIRASVDDGNFAVRFDGKHIKSDAGAEVRATPFKVLVTLGRIDALARETKGYHSFRGYALDQFGFEAFGFRISPGQSSRMIMIGCHTFKTMEIRVVMRQLQGMYPEATKAAKRFVKRNPVDYGVAAYQAEQRARYGNPSRSLVMHP